MSNTAWPFYPLALLHDCARLLALINQKQARLNAQGRLQMGSVSRLAGAMLLRPQASQPRSEAQAPELSWLLELLEQAALVEPHQGRLRLSAAAHRWLDLPASLQMDRLRQAWWLDPILEARWLPPTRRQWPLKSRWKALVLETSRWVAGLSPWEWTPTSDLQTYLEDRGMLGAVGAGRNLPQVRRALNEQSQRLADLVLRFMLPGLGLVELNDAEGKSRLRPTPEGAAWLQVALLRSKLFIQPPEGVAVEEDVPHHELRFPAPEGPPISITPDLGLSVGLAAPAAHVFDLAHLAELVALGPPTRYRVTLPSLQQAVGWGYPVSNVILMLSRFSGAPLPPAALAQLRKWRQKVTLVPCEPGYRLRLSAPVILQTLRHKEPFRRRTLAFASGPHAWVSQAQSRGLLRYLRHEGYVPQLPEVADDDERAPLDPPLRAPWPLLQWLVLLRTYGSLRQRLPGLADLGLQDLQAALEAALAPDDLAAAERLVASHEALIGRGLGSRPPPLDAPDDVPLPWSDAPDDAPGREEADALVAYLEAAIQSDAALDMTYADTEGRVTRRRVRPLELQARQGRQYLIAYCELRQAERRFRLDRVVRIEGDGG
jgi:hypothetical protein